MMSLVTTCGVAAISVYYGYFYGRFIYLLYMLPAIILTLIAQSMVNSAYSKYSRVPNSRGMTGEMAARAVLSAHGITNVRIEPTSGKLTDHYSPKENVIRLSEGVYSKGSVAAVCIAAHEAGHAVQHAQGYVPNKIRSFLIPISNFTSQLAGPLLIIGFLIDLFVPYEVSDFILTLSVVFYSFAVLVYIVTLPVEFNASARALKTIKETGMLDQSEYGGAKKVLRAAALTYVASALSALLNFLRILMIVASRTGGRRDD